MRIPIWPGIRLSVGEPQNPDAVKVVTPFVTPYQPIRRVLSKRGWMLLLVRYDWKKIAPAAADCPGYESTPNRCGCSCEGCKHHCAAHQATAATDTREAR